MLSENKWKHGEKQEADTAFSNLYYGKNRYILNKDKTEIFQAI